MRAPRRRQRSGECQDFHIRTGRDFRRAEPFRLQCIGAASRTRVDLSRRQRLHRVRAATGLKNRHVQVRPQVDALERDAEKSVSLGTILRHADDFSPQVVDFADSRKRRDHDFLRGIVGDRRQDHRIGTIQPRANQRRHSRHRIIEIAGNQRLNIARAAAHEHHLRIKAMLMENPGLLSQCRNDHLLACGNVSDDNFFSLLPDGAIMAHGMV